MLHLDGHNQGSLVKRLREEQGLSQAELGKRAGTTQHFISKIESGIRNAPISTLVSLLEALGAQLVVLTKEELDTDSRPGGTATAGPP